MTLSFLSMGRETYQVSMEKVFVSNRSKLLENLRKAGVSSGVIFLEGGRSTTRFDSDHEPIFRQESYFWYMCGVKEPDCSLSMDVATGECCLYVPELPPSYATIMGRIRPLSEWKAIYSVDDARHTEEIKENLLGLLQKPSRMNGHTNGNSQTTTKLLLLQGLNSDSDTMYEPPVLITSDTKFSPYVDTEILFPVLAECRVVKSMAELDLLRHVTEVTSFAHAYVMRNMKPGMMEYQGESLFRHYCYYNYGCRLVGYTPICGCGPSAAVLHYGHAGEPNNRQSKVGDICLFDIGAEYFGYGSDVTCSFPIDGKFTDKQLPIFNAVLHAQIAVYDMMKPGVSWVDCHKEAEKAILKDLSDIGIVLLAGKSIDELVEMRLGAVFMPHGLGHLIGIDTHDVGGYLPGTPNRIQLPGLKSLRTARVLKEMMTLTVEPGCYFIQHLIDEALAHGSPLRCHLDAEKVREYLDFGGVRLEDVVLVTRDGCENFTLCPRTPAEIEGVMGGAKWPPLKDEAPELRRARLTNPNPLPPPPSA